MERSRAAKSKFKMKSSALRAGESIMGRFMAMGKTLGNSKTDAKVTIDPSKYYTPPSKKEEKKPESASKILKNRKAQIELDKMDDTQTLKDLNITGKVDYNSEDFGKDIKLGIQ